MKSLDKDYLTHHPLLLNLARLLQTLSEYKGKQELYTHQTPQVLETLKEAAIIQSTESSNRIEGITVLPQRLKSLMLKKARPLNRSEAEVVGYRNVLAKIHTQAQSLEVSPSLMLELHKNMLRGTGLTAGEWKKRDNTIEEKSPDGRWISRFVPVPAHETPFFINTTCHNLHRLWHDESIPKLIIIPSFILDFLCIHPFADGNGRMSRLLTVLLLHKAGYLVGRFISLERVIEDSKESYYETLQKASQHWHEGHHNIKPWWEYFMSTLVTAYQEFEERVGILTHARGAKTNIVQAAIRNMPKTFSITDLERSCPNVGRDMIRVVLNKMRSKGEIACSGTGRSAVWKK